jgi:DNA-binding NarL/FixJ family response regulator
MPATVTDRLERLTRRERDVLALMAEGRSNQGIAETLVVAEKTIECHASRIMTKLELTAAPRYHRRVVAVLTHLRALQAA